MGGTSSLTCCTSLLLMSACAHRYMEKDLGIIYVQVSMPAGFEQGQASRAAELTVRQQTVKEAEAMADALQAAGIAAAAYHAQMEPAPRQVLLLPTGWAFMLA